MGRKKLFVAFVVCALSLCAAPKLELRGKVTGSVSGLFRIGLYGIGQPYQQNLVILPGQEFRFRPLESGSYTLVVAKRGIGSVRRTVVVTPSLADKKGVVRFNLPYVPAEAALEGRGALVSRGELSVPDKAWRKFIEARARMARHETARAVESLIKAVEVAPQFSAAWNTLGVMSYQDRDYPKAEEYFRKAVEAEPESFDVIVNLGGVLLITGKWQEALANNQKAQAARPQDPLANAQLGLSYFQMGDNDRAEPYLAAAQRIDPAHFTRPQLYLARIYLQRGDTNRARSELWDFIKRYPDAPEAKRLREQLGE
jgi:Tfp pilus assembly protein PilF